MDITRILKVAFCMLIGAGTVSCSDSKQGDEPTPPTTTTPRFTKRYNTGMKFYSNTLQQEVPYTVLLPEEYLADGDESRYDVMYLFHGYGDTEESWNAGHFDIQKVADAAQTEGIIRPIIYVMPRGFNSYYVNAYDGSFSYMDMMTKELIPLIDRLFRTNATARGRAVAGMSMGGFGALAMASKNPGMFGTCIGMSPSLNTDEQYRTLGGWDKQWGEIFGGVGTTGEARLTSHYKSLCPLHFFANNPAQYASINYLIDCGDDEERLYIGNGELHSLMRDMGIKHEYRVRDGAHNSAYWRPSLREGLALFEHTLAGKDYPAAEEVSLPQIKAPEAEKKGDITIYRGKAYQGNATSHIIYCEIGQGGAQLDEATVAEAMAQQMETRNVAVAVVKSSYFSNNTIENLFATVESHLGVEVTDSRRHLMVYGNGVEALVNYAFSDAAVAALYVEDSNCPIPDNARFNAKTYMLDMTDMGTNHREMLTAFRVLRDNEARVQYRVRNGADDKASAKQGIYSLTLMMSIPVK